MGFPKPELSRRTFIGSAAVLAAGTAAGFTGCAPQNLSETSSASFTPGTYTATARGKRNPITVEVTFDEAEILEVSIAKANETRRIADMALETIPADIVAYQSLNIDAVTGATLTSNAILTAVSDCVDQAGGDSSKLKTADGAPRKTDVVDLEADVIVCGAGASGIAAAVAAAESGAENVIVLEKTSNMGGNCLVSGGYLEYINPPQEMRAQMNDGFAELFESTLSIGLEMGVPQEYADKVRADYDAYYASGYTTVFDSEELYAIDYVHRAGGTIETWQAYAPMIVDLSQWLTDIGFQWRKPCCAIVGFPWPRQSASVTGNCGEGFFDTFEHYTLGENLPVQIIPLTPMTELIVENGAVVGVVGTCDDGTTYNIRSKKGVILATGGFAGNPDMLKQYNTKWDWSADTAIPTTNAFGHTGDAITLTRDLSAAVALVESPMVFPYADCQNYSTETIVGDTGNCLIVGTEGKRFVDESLSREDISKAIMAQSEEKMFIISDAENCLIDDGITQFGADANKLIEDGHLFRADSLEELAGLMGVDAKALTDTVDKFNGMVNSGKDPDYGRTVFTETSYVKTPPFYASPRTWAAHITLGGLVVDEHFQVLTEEGVPIEGLYCVGECACGFGGIGSMCTGMVCGRQLVA